MSMLYRPSMWVWCDKAKKMVKRNPGRKVNALTSRASIPSQLSRFGR